MTARGRLAVALGAATYLAAWAFGSKPLYPVALGLLLAVVAGHVAVAVSKRPMRLVRGLDERDHVEGDDVVVELRLEHEVGGRLAFASMAVSEQVGRVGARLVPLTRSAAGLRGQYVLRELPRGRYSFSGSRAVLEDAFGLERREIRLDAPGALLVYPRLVELEGVFSDAGSYARHGRRLLLRRPSGFDLHGVREYEQGESLRRVHWPATAKRGQLMVKDVEDSPRDEVAVVLDADATAVGGHPPRSSFDLQVRAAGSLLQAHVRRGRRAALVVNAARREFQRVHSADGDWRAALELLAAVEPTGTTPLAAVLAEEAGSAARALELVVVTASLQSALVDRLLQWGLGRRRVSLVLVDAASFDGRTNETSLVRRRSELLRLAAAGVPAVVVGEGDDLAAKLGDDRVAGVAYG
jgi:uncharacterized protein (DUF58 family)